MAKGSFIQFLWPIYIYKGFKKNNKLWSTTYAPTYEEPDSYKVEFSTYKANFYRKDGDIETKMDVFLLPEELGGEIRKVQLTNNGEEEALLETISYFEIVGERLESDLAHPAFNNLFIRTEALEEQEGLLAHRRKRSEDIQDNWILHGGSNPLMVMGIDFNTKPIEEIL